MLLNEREIFWANIEKIKNSLFLDDQEFAATIGLGLKDFLKCKKKSEFLPLNCMFEFAEKMNFHLEDIMTTNFNFKQETKTKTGKFLLDERYSYATYSETRPLRNIISYLQMVRGERAKINLIRKFQMTEDFFTQTEQKTNIFLITDIVNHLDKTYKFTDAELIRMGQRTPFTTENTFLNDRLTKHKNVQDVVASFFEECTHLFDKNYHYKISTLADEYAIIEAAPRKYVLDELKISTTDFGSEKVCLTRMGIISSMTYYKYGVNAPVSKISSLHNGDQSHRYYVDLSPFKNLSRFPDRRIKNADSIYH